MTPAVWDVPVDTAFARGAELVGVEGRIDAPDHPLDGFYLIRGTRLVASFYAIARYGAGAGPLKTEDPGEYVTQRQERAEKVREGRVNVRDQG